MADPGPELERLYITLFRPRWRRTRSEIDRDGLGRFLNLIQALPAAAIYKGVWDKPLPFMTAKERAAMFEGQEHMWNKEIAYLI